MALSGTLTQELLKSDEDQTTNVGKAGPSGQTGDLGQCPSVAESYPRKDS